MIETSTLTKRYANLVALDELNLHVRAGETFGLLGPNGAGKTTTLRLLTGLTQATSGTITIDGLDPWRHPAQVRRRIGVMLDGALYERMTVAENLRLFADLYGVGAKQVDEALVMTGVDDLRNRRAGKLSKGQKHRVGLARALVHAPQILFLDEPTSGLDPNAVDQFHDLLRRLKAAGVTIILASHNMAEVELLCDRVAILDKGQVRALGEPVQLRSQFGRRNLLVQVETSSGTKSLTFSLDEPDIGRHLTDCQQAGRILSVHSEEASLAEVFVQLTGRALS